MKIKTKPDRYLRKNCVICQKPIPRGSYHSMKTRRGRLDVTCKKSCGKIYLRAYKYIIGMQREKK